VGTARQALAVPLGLAAVALAACGASNAPLRASAPAAVTPSRTISTTSVANGPSATTTSVPARRATAPVAGVPTTLPLGTSSPTSGTPARGVPGATVPAPGAPATTVPTTTVPTTTASSTVSSSATAGGLTVTVTASPPHLSPGQALQVTVSARDPGAHGALAYQLAYGDGRGAHNVTPLLCTASVSPQAQTWAFSHAYATAGTYTVSATVTANCTPDHATVPVAVAVS
jgi:hypothetical protein